MPTNAMLTTTVMPSTTTLAAPFLFTSMSHRMSKSTSVHKHVSKDFSPVTLSMEWSSMTRLLVLSALSVFGSIGNVFMISSVMIEDHLKKAGKCGYY